MRSSNRALIRDEYRVEITSSDYGCIIWSNEREKEKSDNSYTQKHTPWIPLDFIKYIYDRKTPFLRLLAPQAKILSFYTWFRSDFAVKNDDFQRKEWV